MIHRAWHPRACARRLALIPVLLSLNSCIVDDLRVIPIAVDESTDAKVKSPVKVHLVDGSTVIFQQGFWVKGGEIVGEGELYDLTLRSRQPIASLDIEQVAAMESYQIEVDKVASSIATGATATVGIPLGAAMLKAMFGSCPTTYTFDGNTPVLEAESFSYSVVPDLEVKDVDRLSVSATDGTVMLEVRNEALETHYINQLELLEVIHDDGTRVVPDPEGTLLATRHPRRPLQATDTEGIDLRQILAVDDGEAWRASDRRLDALNARDLDDHIDLVFETESTKAPRALVLRLRNSLLNTVMFYDVMLKGLGFEALDWMGGKEMTLDMMRSALWYQRRMGMTVSVWTGSSYREVARVGDQGPIAWKEIAIPIPAQSDRTSIRLSFIADNWRLDSAVLADMAEVTPTPVAVNDVNVDHAESIAESLRTADARYLVTRPGDSMQLTFDVSEVPHGKAATYFLSATGYYMEWMRGDWLKQDDPVAARTEVASDEALWKALQLWQSKRDSFRQQFENTKVTTR